MDEENVPKILYKYLPDSHLEYIFNKKTLRFSPVKDFNDPFELKATVRDINPKDILSILYRTGNLIQKYIDCVNNMTQQRINDIVHDILNSQKDIHGILCLSEVNNSILMWSHYAYSHKGFCIGINIEKLRNHLDKTIHTDKSIVKKVIYNEKPKNITRILDTKDIIDIYFRKSDMWSYEKEWRMVLPYRKVKGSQYKPINTDGIITFPEDALEYVIFGVNTRQEIKNRVLKRVKENSFYTTKIKEAVMDENTYSIHIEDYPLKI